MPLLIGLDLGTTSIKAVLYDSETGRIRSQASRPTPVFHPREGWSEHDPAALWQCVCGCLREAVAGQPPAQGLGIASMAEAGVAIGADGLALDPAIAWFDRRSEPQTAWLEAQISSPELYAITGQRVSPSFGLTKLLWLRENRPGVFHALRCWLPIPAYILYRLTGERAVDLTIASRSLLFDQNLRTWSPRLCQLAGLSPTQLPALVSGSAPAGRLTHSAAAECGLPPGLLCAAGSHDHLCAAFAAGALRPGAAVDSTGTAQAVVQVLPAFRPDPRLAEQGFACYAHVLPDQFILKAGLKAAGGAVDWLARLLSGMNREPDYPALESAARIGLGTRSGPLWLPHLLESGSPDNDRLSRAALVGVKIQHTAGDIYRGMLEALAFWLRLNLECMQEFTQTTPEPVALIGGVTRIRLLSELKAHILNRQVAVPTCPEAAAVGAALLGGLAGGVFADPAQALSSQRYPVETIDPNQQLALWYARLYEDIYRPLYPALAPLNRRFP